MKTNHILNFLIVAAVMQLPLFAVDSVLYSPSQSAYDYDCIVQLTQRSYSGALTGEKPEAVASYSAEKWYFDAAFFQDQTLVKYVSFPAALLVKQADFEVFKPTVIKFMPRDPNEAGYRELLTVENGWIFKYNLWIEKDATTGQLSLSVDLGKRTPIYVASKIDQEYSPVADATGNIFFKTRSGISYKWDSSTESCVKVTTLPSQPASDVASPVGLAMPTDESPEIIDPLDIANSDSLASAMGAASFSQYSNMVRELKKIMREMGVRSSLRKWLTDSEVTAIETSLLVGSTLAGGIVGPLDTQSKAWSIRVSSSGKLYMPWSYYRFLKSSIRNRKLNDPSQWENYSDVRANNLIQTVQRFSKKVVTAGSNLKNFMDEFLAVNEQASWQNWFEIMNTNLHIELLFDYLATLPEEKLKNVLTQAGVTGLVKQRRILMIVKAYTTSNVYSGLKVKKMKK